MSPGAMRGPGSRESALEPRRPSRASARAPRAVGGQAAATREARVSMLPHGFAEDVRIKFRHHEQRRRGRDVLEILGDLRGVDCVPDLLSSKLVSGE